MDGERRVKEARVSGCTIGEILPLNVLADQTACADYLPSCRPWAVAVIGSAVLSFSLLSLLRRYGYGQARTCYETTLPYESP